MGFNKRKMEDARKTEADKEAAARTCALDRHPDAAITSLIPALSCRSCRPNAPFAELVQLSQLSVTDEWNLERGRALLGE